MLIRAAMAGTMALAGLLATAPTAAWASSPRLGETELASLRDTLAATAPAGSVTYLDKTNSTIIMRVPGKRTHALASAIGRRGTQVSVTEDAIPVVSQLMLYGGMHMETAFQERFCSTGFITEGGGWRWMVTAGHCVWGGAGNTAYWYTEGGYEAGGLIGVGTILDPSYPGDDFGAIQISRISPHQTGPHVLKDGQPLRITRLSTVWKGKGNYLGTEVCKTGRTTGTTCGNVINTDVSVTYHDGVVDGLIEANNCSATGDSGSPLFHAKGQPYIVDGHVRVHQSAYGVLSGGNSAVCGSSSARSYYQPLGEVLTYYGLTLVL